MKIAFLCAFMLASGYARADEQRLAVIVGCNIGASDEEPLKYAERDAQRMRDVLSEIGEVRSDRALLVVGNDIEALWRALKEARGRAAELANAGARVTFFFYYSGHGDGESLHLGKSKLFLATLKRALDDIAATTKVSIIDACRTGGRQKGVKPGPEFSLALPQTQSGTIELRASSDGEAAQESEMLAGAVFTHYMLAAMRGDGDIDRDGAVTLSELYTYAYRRTLLKTSSGVALQHPSLLSQLSGSGEIVLSYPSRAAAFIELPDVADRYLVFSLPSASVVSELIGPATLALPSGRYLVARRAGAAIAASEIDLSWGGTKKLRAGDFKAVSSDQWSSKGGGVRALSLEATGGADFVLGAADGPALRVGARLSHAMGRLVVGLDAAYLHGGVRTPALSGRADGVSVSPFVSLRGMWGPITLSGMTFFDFRYVWQRLDLIDAERARLGGMTSSWQTSYGAVGLRAGPHFAVALGHHFAAHVDASVGVLLRQEVEVAAMQRLTARLLITTNLGISYAF